MMFFAGWFGELDLAQVLFEVDEHIDILGVQLVVIMFPLAENMRSELALEAWMQIKISQSGQEEGTVVLLHANILGCLRLEGIWV